MANRTDVHSLIPLTDFTALLGIDDREESLSRYVLVSSTYTIEHYCLRQLLKKKHTDYLGFTGDYRFTLREYPVRELLAVHYDLTRRFGTERRLPPELYHTVGDTETADELPGWFAIEPRAHLQPGEGSIRVRYRAGYQRDEVPADLKSACLELAAWNMTRYRGQRICMTGDHLERSMPEQVRQLLEPYRRRTI